MKSERGDMVATIGRAYAACLGAGAEVGTLAVRSAAQESRTVALATARALRAPMTERGPALEHAVRLAYDAQTRHLHALRGASSLLGMAFLHRLDAEQED